MERGKWGQTPLLGDYGREEDKNLAALCRVHHQELHDSTKLRKNTFYQSRYVIEEMKVHWQELQTDPVQSTRTVQRAPSPTFSEIIDRLARPIWRILTLFSNSREW